MTGVATAAVLAVSMTGCARVPGVYTYVAPGQDATSGSKASAAFDATTYVKRIWASKVLPTVAKSAVPAAQLLPALQSHQSAASKQYGNQAGTGSPFAFLIRGTGTVTAVDRSAPTHPATIKVDGLTGKAWTVQVVTGPVIAGTALRDGMKFITFGDFTNQIDYADVATALNTKVKTDVLAGVRTDTLVGKKVTFAGAFSLVAPGSIQIVPTQLTVAP